MGKQNPNFPSQQDQDATTLQPRRSILFTISSFLGWNLKTGKDILESAAESHTFFLRNK